MYLAQIEFSILESLADDLQSQTIYNFLAVLLHDGRIGDDYQILEGDSVISAYVTIPAKDAFEGFEDNQYIPDHLEKLDAVKLSRPTFKILGQTLDGAESCSCRRRKAFILYTSYVPDSISPLHCFDCFEPVPLYRLPRLKSGEFFEVYIWKRDYQSCDSLQMHCQTGERFALREMSRIDSSLTLKGLEICREIRSLTEKPVYYYLYKHYGISERTERERKCPSCNGEWLLDEPFHELFDFRCERCHLLSNIAFSLR